MKACMVCLQCKNCVIHISERFTSELLAMGRYSNLPSFTCDVSVSVYIQDSLTALHCATRSGKHDAAMTLIQRGASLSAKTRNCLTPLHVATQGDHTDCLELLLASGADVDDVSIVCVHSFRLRLQHCQIESNIFDNTNKSKINKHMKMKKLSNCMKKAV